MRLLPWTHCLRQEAGQVTIAALLVLGLFSLCLISQIQPRSQQMPFSMAFPHPGVRGLYLTTSGCSPQVEALLPQQVFASYTFNTSLSYAAWHVEANAAPPASTQLIHFHQMALQWDPSTHEKTRGISIAPRARGAPPQLALGKLVI